MKEKLDNKINCQECNKIIVYDPALKSGDSFGCPCGKITVQLYTVTTLKGKVVKD